MARSYRLNTTNHEATNESADVGPVEALLFAAQQQVLGETLRDIFAGIHLALDLLDHATVNLHHRVVQCHTARAHGCRDVLEEVNEINEAVE